MRQLLLLLLMEKGTENNLWYTRRIHIVIFVSTHYLYRRSYYTAYKETIDCHLSLIIFYIIIYYTPLTCIMRSV